MSNSEWEPLIIELSQPIALWLSRLTAADLASQTTRMTSLIDLEEMTAFALYMSDASGAGMDVPAIRGQLKAS